MMALAAVAILAVMISEMQVQTSTAYAVAVIERDRVQAEYMAKSAINLTRLLVAREPEVRQLLAPMIQGFIGK
ncbi:MAG: type II secretion system protein GspK, partial [Polyangiales bacterium]